MSGTALYADEKEMLFLSVAKRNAGALAHAPASVTDNLALVVAYLKGVAPEDADVVHDLDRTQDLLVRAENFKHATFAMDDKVAVKLAAANPWVLQDSRLAGFQSSKCVVVCALEADWNCNPASLQSCNNSICRAAVSATTQDGGHTRLLPNIWTDDATYTMNKAYDALVTSTSLQKLKAAFKKICKKPWTRDWAADTETLHTLEHRLDKDKNFPFTFKSFLYDQAIEVVETDILTCPDADATSLETAAWHVLHGSLAERRDDLMVQQRFVKSTPKAVNEFLHHLPPSRNADADEAAMDALGILARRMPDKESRAIGEEVAKLAAPSSAVVKRDRDSFFSEWERVNRVKHE